ncbi:MAG: cyanoexosortase C [Drouetiella hepatica Uher 2000/2452]|jgi:exosortase/archaeosortase family protein|uniref:Cyanoexosortase C n=1 Tax=Drouetiella hepatica Uher 2000/2452 TaxID=904376 RepID=A0A951QF27_9CYAN|nr:cyanoexosortase C [Drouetiella hepatica Uher 2000/2452]
MSKSIGQGYQHCLSLLQLSFRTNHNRIITCGLAIGLVYLSRWAGSLLATSLEGSSTPTFNIGFLCVGLTLLWRDRHALNSLKSYEEEQFTGELLILGGAGAFAVCQSSFEMQTLTWMLILLSMVWSTWGFAFFHRFWLPTVFVMISQYPDYAIIKDHVLTLNLLGSSMAWISSLVFQVFGQPATAQDALLSLSVPLDPAKSVLIDSGCNGLSMALKVAAAGLIGGLLLQLSYWTTIRLMAIGVVLALLFNVVRIVLLAIAVVYWGKDWFNFWHGPWGGQIFSGILFTVYYYSVQGWITSPAPQKSEPQKTEPQKTEG